MHRHAPIAARLPSADPARSLASDPMALGRAMPRHRGPWTPARPPVRDLVSHAHATRTQTRRATVCEATGRQLTRAMVTGRSTHHALSSPSSPRASPALLDPARRAGARAGLGRDALGRPGQAVQDRQFRRGRGPERRHDRGRRRRVCRRHLLDQGQRPDHPRRRRSPCPPQGHRAAAQQEGHLRGRGRRRPRDLRAPRDLRLADQRGRRQQRRGHPRPGHRCHHPRLLYPRQPERHPHQRHQRDGRVQRAGVQRRGRLRAQHLRRRGSEVRVPRQLLASLGARLHPQVARLREPHRL